MLQILKCTELSNTIDTWNTLIIFEFKHFLLLNFSPLHSSPVQIEKAS